MLFLFVSFFFTFGFIVYTRLSADKCVKYLRERVRKREHQLRGKRQRRIEQEKNRDWVKLEKGNTGERITVVAKRYLQTILSIHELPFKMLLPFIILFNKISPIFKCRPDSLLSLSALSISFFFPLYRSQRQMLLCQFHSTLELFGQKKKTESGWDFLW